MPPARLLIVAYTFPPMPTIGANRWDAMARHLRALGHEVHVVTTSAFGAIRDPGQERYVIRAGDLTSSRWVRTVFRRGAIPPGSDVPGVDASRAPAESPLPDPLRKIFVPDLYVATWVPQALRAARRAVSELAIDCVITSSPYESAHLLGNPLRRRGPAWIADFRDGWSFEPHRPPFPTVPQRALDRRMEKQVVTGADRVVTATRPIAEDFGRRLGVDAIHVANGFDPAKFPELPALALPPLPDGAVTLAHTGKLGGVNNRDPRGLFEAIRRIVSEDPGAGERLRLLLAGRLDTEDLGLVAETGLEEQIVLMGQLSHAESLALQRRVDALVLVASEGSEVTGKLFEYLSAGRPILALGGTEVARTVSETQTGVALPPHDVEGITAQLRRLLSGELAAAYRPTNLEAYVYPGPARRMAAVIGDAIVARQSAEDASP
jgi:glycosyltransferase involved in cell wall biosynthesis